MKTRLGNILLYPIYRLYLMVYRYEKDAPLIGVVAVLYAHLFMTYISISCLLWLTTRFDLLTLFPLGSSKLFYLSWGLPTIGIMFVILGPLGLIRKTKQIFKTDPYGRCGTILTVVYFIAPFVVALITMYFAIEQGYGLDKEDPELQQAE